mgnify:CR=1 FL=1
MNRNDTFDRTNPRWACVCLDSWAGRQEITVQVVGETAKRYRIRAVVPTKLPRRVLEKGEETLVPKRAVRFQ